MAIVVKSHVKNDGLGPPFWLFCFENKTTLLLGSSMNAAGRIFQQVARQLAHNDISSSGAGIVERKKKKSAALNAKIEQKIKLKKRRKWWC